MSDTNVFRGNRVHVQAKKCETCIYRPVPRPTTPCEEWTGATNKGGYGVIKREGRTWRAHRWVWQQAHGPIPLGHIIMHRCDNPPCVRLDHLMIGTHKRNSDDKFGKGRAVILRGEGNGKSRLTAQQVVEILDRRQQGQSLRSIAREYGVSPGAIQHIDSGANWRHIVTPIRGGLMNLEPGRVDQMQADAIRDGGVIPCHQTIEAYTGESGEESVCRGFFDVAKHEGLLAVAERMGIVEFTS